MGVRLSADAVLVTGGAWTKRLGESLGVTLTIYPQRGQIMHLDLPGVVTTKWPVILGFGPHYILAFPESRVVAGATREHDSGYDPRMTAGGVHEALGEALRVAPGLAGATLHEVRIGLRPAEPRWPADPRRGAGPRQHFRRHRPRRIRSPTRPAFRRDDRGVGARARGRGGSRAIRIDTA